MSMILIVRDIGLDLETGETKGSDNLPLCLFRWWKSSEEWISFSLWVFGESKVQRKDIVEIERITKSSEKTVHVSDPLSSQQFENHAPEISTKSSILYM